MLRSEFFCHIQSVIDLLSDAWQVVVKMLKRRDVLRLACYTELVRLSECGVSVLDLGLAVSLLDKDLSQADSAVSKAQQRR